MKKQIIYLLLFCLISCVRENYKQVIYIDNPYYDSAYSYLDRGISDSAFLAFSQAKDLFIEAGDSLNTANCLINMAITQKEQGDYYGAQETSLQASTYLDESNPEHRIYLSSNYNNLASATDFLKDYKNAISFYNSAIMFSNDTILTHIYKNNIAIAYQNIGQYDKALDILYELNIQTTNKKSMEYARVLSNFARFKWHKNKDYNPIAEFIAALKIREYEKDLWGQNASFSHLADYYITQKKDSALFYAERMYEVAERLQSPTDRLKALHKLIELSPENSAKAYFRIYQQLSDSVQLARAAAKNQFALIRYEVEKNKADNLLLQKDNAEKTYKLTRQRVITGGVTILFVVFTVTGTFYYKKRKQRLELEAENQIKANKLETSKKVHDVVANGLYRVMKEIEYKQVIDREYTLDKLEEMYNKSRDISYESEEGVKTDQPYYERLNQLLKSFSNDGREIFIIGNEAELWKSIGEQSKEHIRQVVQELMVNMDKHSQAENVVIRFEKKGDHLSINYSDDGIGIKKDTPHGNGLTNTVSRIKSLSGKIIFVDEMVKGLKIKITIPFL
ncbi:tetratricopeptide repeat-containing sensor histidine kinase [Sphingobacterium wenxiniae]|nr:ATP-binding protein [Sphingobacterium wenxiniae]